MSDLMAPPDMAEYLSTNVNTLAYWRCTGYGPKWGKIGRRVFYRRSDVETWVAAQFDAA